MGSARAPIAMSAAHRLQQGPQGMTLSDSSRQAAAVMSMTHPSLARMPTGIPVYSRLCCMFCAEWRLRLQMVGKRKQHPVAAMSLTHPGIARKPFSSPVYTVFIGTLAILGRVRLMGVASSCQSSADAVFTQHGTCSTVVSTMSTCCRLQSCDTCDNHDVHLVS